MGFAPVTDVTDVTLATSARQNPFENGNGPERMADDPRPGWAQHSPRVCHECHECHALACLFHFRALVNVRVMCPPVSGLESLPVNSPSASMLASKARASSALPTIRAR